MRHLHRKYTAHTSALVDLASRGSAPNEHVMDCLQTLSADSRNTVVILSGRNYEMMEDWFGKVPRLGLAAERGRRLYLRAISCHFGPMFAAFRRFMTCFGDLLWHRQVPRVSESCGKRLSKARLLLQVALQHRGAVALPGSQWLHYRH